MDAYDWLTVIGLALSVFGVAWGIFLTPRPSRKGVMMASLVALIASLAAATALIAQKTSVHYYRSIIAGDASALLSGPRYQWTFRPPRGGRSRIRYTGRTRAAIRPQLQSVIDRLVEDGHFMSRVLTFNVDTPPDEHAVIVYCKKC